MILRGRLESDGYSKTVEIFFCCFQDVKLFLAVERQVSASHVGTSSGGNSYDRGQQITQRK